jgi:hypothetical protein
MRTMAEAEAMQMRTLGPDRDAMLRRAHRDRFHADRPDRLAGSSRVRAYDRKR